MLTVTERALAHIAKMLDQHALPTGTVVRFSLDDNSMSLMPDTPRSDDVVFRHAGRSVLVVNEMLADALDGQSFVVVSTAEGDRLTLELSDAGASGAFS